MYGVDLDRLFADDRLNAGLAWAVLGLLGLLAVREAVVGDPVSAAVVAGVAVLAALPGPFYRSLSVTMPWEVVAAVAAVLAWLALAPGPLPAYLTVAAVGLVVALELEVFTPVEMSHRFAAGFVVVATSAAAGAWAVARWLADGYLGTSLLPGHDALMLGFVASTVAGLGAAVLFDLHVRHWEARLDRLTPLLDDGRAARPDPAGPGTGDRAGPAGGSGRDPAVRADVLRLGAWLTARRKARLSRAMMLAVGGVVLVSAVQGDASLLLNAGFGLGVTLLPGAVERDLRVTMDPGLTLWVTTAVFLHVVGAVGIPGLGTFYSDVWWWDHVTHAASASLVAGAGYAAVRAVDEHSDLLVLPRRFTFALVLLFVLAFGVYWEVLEFAVGHVRVGGESALTQYGVEDTMKDLVFDAVGGVLAATYGSAHLSGVVADLQRRLEDASGRK